MLTPGVVVFVNLPEQTSQRVLHAAKVVQNGPSGLVIRCDEPGLPLIPERAIRLYYEIKQKFMQQPARIEAILDTGEALAGSPPADTASPPNPEAGPLGASLVIKTLGEPVSAESRQCYRVSTLMAGLKADIGQEKRCVLADVSNTGFAIIASTGIPQGTTHPVLLHHEGKQFPGQGLIQSVKDLGKGKCRYGLLCADPGNAQRTPLKQGLQQISVAVQRQQLRRLAGAA
jgi:hypothetical protein